MDQRNFDNKENLGHGIKGENNKAAQNSKDSKNSTNNQSKDNKIK